MANSVVFLAAYGKFTTDLSVASVTFLSVPVPVKRVVARYVVPRVDRVCARERLTTPEGGRIWGQVFIGEAIRDDIYKPHTRPTSRLWLPKDRDKLAEVERKRTKY